MTAPPAPGEEKAIVPLLPHLSDKDWLLFSHGG
jgi:hypothetical protein